MHLPLFAYGSLLDPDVFEVVSGLDPARVRTGRGRLDGFRVARVAGTDYPTLVAAPQARAEGLLYFGLGPAAMHRIMLFEGELYRLARGVVGTGRSRRQAVFFIADPVRAAPEEWRLDAWQKACKAEALPRIRLRMREAVGPVGSVPFGPVASA